MSSAVNHYVMIGSKYDYEDFYNRIAQHNGFATVHSAATRKTVEPYLDVSYGGITHYNNVSIIPDTLNKEYVYVGFVAFKSKDGGDVNDFGTDPVELPKNVDAEIIKALGFTKETELLAFTHRR